ncbi:hypothetical protein RMQ97_14840 [Maricaulis sp. D1M11]
MADVKIENGVLIGDEGELFLAQGAHSIIEYATGARSVDVETVKNFAWNVKERSAFCDRRNTPFLQIVAPEKYKVEDRCFPIQGAKSFWDYHDDFDSGVVWYGQSDLKNNRFGRSYYKTDTHWTVAGMMLATERIAKQASFSKEELDQLEIRMKDICKPLGDIFYGDLGRKLDPQQGEDVDWPRLAPSIRVAENGITHDYSGTAVNDGRLVCLRNEESVSDKKLLIFGDSYLFNALRLLALAFRDVLFCRTRFFHRELVVMNSPDIVVSQAAERYTRVVSQDSKAPPFLLLPFVLGRKLEMSADDAVFISSFLRNRREPDYSEYNLKKS